MSKCPTCGSNYATIRGRLSNGHGAMPNSGIYYCEDIWHKRVIDHMDEVDDAPIVPKRRATPRFNDLTKLANRIYDIHTPEEYEDN